MDEILDKLGETIAAALADKFVGIGTGHVGDPGLAFDGSCNLGLESRGGNIVPLISRIQDQFVGTLDSDKWSDPVKIESEGFTAIGPDRERAVAGIPTQGYRRVVVGQVKRTSRLQASRSANQ